MVSHELRAPLTSIKGSAATVLGARIRRSARSPRPLLARPRCPGRRRTRDRHRGQALVEDGGQDQRRAPADRGDGRRAGGGRESGSCPPATGGRRALDELHVEDDAGHGMHTAGPTTDLEERPAGTPVAPSSDSMSVVNVRSPTVTTVPRGTRGMEPK